MPPTETNAQVVLYAVVALAVLAALGVLVLLRINGRLARIERRLAILQDETHHSLHPGESLDERKAANREQKDLFRQFLDEDPERRNLPKKEQFAGFRRWRQEKGLNWQA